MTVTNNGPSDATDVSLTQTLPVGARFISATAPGDACIESESWVICVLDRLPSGDTAEAVVVIGFESAGTLVSTVSVSGAETDPNSANDEVTVQVTVIPASGGFPVAAIIAIVVGIAAIGGGALVYLRRGKAASRELAGSGYPIRFSWPCHSRSRSTNFWILPVAVLGSSPNSRCFGHL